MKSNKLWGALPLLLSALSACGGESAIGKGEDTGKGVAGSTATGSGATGNTGSMSSGGKTGSGNAGSTSMGAYGQGATMGGTPVPGNGAVPGEGTCMTDTDCGRGPCEMCADGSMLCSKSYCSGGRCVIDNVGGCPTKCSDDTDCIVGDSAMGCLDCGDGTRTCPSGSCVMGFCQVRYQGCKNADPCAGLACGEVCDSCPNGMCDPMTKSYCSREGKCLPEIPSCAGGTACETKMDCGTAPPMCVSCGDGSCAEFECIASKCVFACPSNPMPECKVSEDCPVIGDQCTMCPNEKCAVQACLQGSCQLVCPVQ